MNIFFSGIGGAGLAPLCLLAQDCGFEVSGYDALENLHTEMLRKSGIQVTVQHTPIDLNTIHKVKPIDWIIGTSALAPNHPHIQWAADNHIRYSKRDGLINEIVKLKKLKMIAVAGTHGKTTTTAMLVWILKNMGIPCTYLIGSNISFGPAAEYQKGSSFFVFEADEFDKNFLHFNPFISVIPSLEYDHPDTYVDNEDYNAAFHTFFEQTEQLVIAPETILQEGNYNSTTDFVGVGIHDASSVSLLGEHNRMNAALALEVIKTIQYGNNALPESELIEIVSKFPGTQRRFELLNERLITDYAHHPSEAKVTIQMAREYMSDTHIENKLIVVFQPHQNLRQYDQDIKNGYKTAFQDADELYWLPTFLSREDPTLRILEPKELAPLTAFTHICKMDSLLLLDLQNHAKKGDVILVMGAGSVDTWIRTHAAEISN